jgi:hypothetical protein
MIYPQIFGHNKLSTIEKTTRVNFFVRTRRSAEAISVLHRTRSTKMHIAAPISYQKKIKFYCKDNADFNYALEAVVKGMVSSCFETGIPVWLFETCFSVLMHSQNSWRRVCVRASERACVCACVRACVRAYVRACVRESERACVRACMRACEHSCLRVCMCACEGAYVCACVHSRIFACVRACVHACVRASERASVRACVCVCVCIACVRA